MAPLTNRRLTIAVGVLLCLGAAAFFVLCRVNYSARRTYARPVYDAVQEGRDPYEAALQSVEELAGGQMFMSGRFAGAVFVGGVIVTIIALRRAI